MTNRIEELVGLGITESNAKIVDLWLSKNETTVFSEFRKVKEKLKQPRKDGTNPNFKSSYVTLDSVIDVIDKAINDSGAKLSFTQETRTVNDSEYVFTILATDNGDTLELRGSTISSGKVMKGRGWVNTDDPQAFGSGFTYARRYSLAAAFGIASEVDDDANKAQSTYKNQGNKSTKYQNTVDKVRKYTAQIGSMKNKYKVNDAQIIKRINEELHLEFVDINDFTKLKPEIQQQVNELIEGWLEK